LELSLTSNAFFGLTSCLLVVRTPCENQPTREGYVIPSEGLAQVFLRQFQSRWKEATEYDHHLKEVLSEIRNHNPTISTELLSSQLQIPETEVKRILSLDYETGPQSVAKCMLLRNWGKIKYAIRHLVAKVQMNWSTIPSYSSSALLQA
jgi:hypothetical protein